MAEGYESLPAGMTESQRARVLAARLLQQSAAASNSPYTSGGVTALKALSGLMGGLQERQALDESQRGAADQRKLFASLLLNGASPSALGAASSGAASPAPSDRPPPSGPV